MLLGSMRAVPIIKAIFTARMIALGFVGATSLKRLGLLASFVPNLFWSIGRSGELFPHLHLKSIQRTFGFAHGISRLLHPRRLVHIGPQLNNLSAM